VRARAESDWPDLLDLWVAAWRVTYTDIDFDARRDWLVAHLTTLESKGARTLCLEHDRKSLAGFVVIDAATGWLYQICVHPACFGHGAAGALLSAARSVSPQLIRLDVNTDNARALAFYQRNGFVRTGEGPISQSGRKTVVMEWRT
jgi:putative acetyltransferase